MVGVLRAVRRLGLSVPNDLSLVACGESELSSLIDPPLAVVRWDCEATGRIAAEILLGRLAEKGAANPQIVTLPSEFVFRDSCAPPPTLA